MPRARKEREGVAWKCSCGTGNRRRRRPSAAAPVDGDDDGRFRSSYRTPLEPPRDLNLQARLALSIVLSLIVVARRCEHKTGAKADAEKRDASSRRRRFLSLPLVLSSHNLSASSPLPRPKIIIKKQASARATTSARPGSPLLVEAKVAIRFQRFGRKKAPFYRLVAIDSRDRREGRPLERLGFYDPLKKETNLNAPAIKKWLAVGAQPSETVANLLKKAMVLEE